MFIGRSTWLIIEVFTRSILLLSRNWAITAWKVFLSLSEYLLEKCQPIPYQQLFGHFHRPVWKGMIVKGIEIRHPSRCGDEQPLCDKEFWTTCFLGLSCPSQRLCVFFFVSESLFLRCKGKSSWKTEIKSR